jgi:hypothetical protein
MVLAAIYVLVLGAIGVILFSLIQFRRDQPLRLFLIIIATLIGLGVLLHRLLPLMKDAHSLSELWDTPAVLSFNDYLNQRLGPAVFSLSAHNGCSANEQGTDRAGATYPWLLCTVQIPVRVRHGHKRPIRSCLIEAKHGSIMRPRLSGPVPEAPS